MKKILALIGLCFLWPNLTWAEIRIRIVDVTGLPVPNAVISINASQEKIDSSYQVDVSAMSPAVMDQVEKQFFPHVLIVERGQSVVFPNSDQVRHHVYSFSKPNDFEIRLYSGDQADPVTFSNPGVAVLGCNIHDQMVGYLYIKDTEVAEVSDKDGLVVFDDASLMTSQEDLVVTVWHSRLSNNKTDRVTKYVRNQDEHGVWQLGVALLPEVQKSSRKFKPRF